MFFDELKEWSERKLNLLRKYLEGSTKILGSIDQVYYVDGFAGRGYYGKPNEPQIPGSPVRAAELAKSYARDGKSYSLKCINVEKDPQIFRELQAATLSYGHHVVNLSGQFVHNVDHILREIGQKPVICFLDPFGVEGMDWVAVQRLVRRSGITEFWIRFDAGEVLRRDGYYNSMQLGADKQFDILSRTFGIADDDVLHDSLVGAPSIDRKWNAVQFYMKRLRDEFKRCKGDGYAEAYRIGSLDEETKYYLVFATAGKKGLVLASDIVYGIEEDYQRELERYREVETGQTSMFDIISPTEDQICEQKAVQLTDIIWAKYRGCTVSRLDIHSGVLDQRFGIIKGPHITKALKLLNNDGRIVGLDGPMSNSTTIITFKR